MDESYVDLVTCPDCTADMAKGDACPQCALIFRGEEGDE